MNNIFNIEHVNFDKIVYGDPIVVEKDKYIVIKLWYDFNSQRNKFDSPETFFIRNPEMTISGTMKDELSFNLDETTKKVYDFYTELDQRSIKYIEVNDILKKYNLKGVRYRTIINQHIDDENINFFRTRIINGSKNPTKVFDIYRNILQQEKQNSILQIGSKVKTIIEPDAIVIDLQNKKIFTNIILRQMLVTYAKFLEPKKVELTEYSFIDSDSEYCNKKEIDNICCDDFNSAIMNTQTECFNGDQNSSSTETSEDIELSPIDSDNSDNSDNSEN